MRKNSKMGLLLAGGCAGLVNGLLGAGGGMLLVPGLTRLTDLEEPEIFPSSVAIMLPICLTSLVMTAGGAPLPWHPALPFLLGSIPGGIAAGILGKKIPVHWLHRGLGILILWGGIRYLCR